MHGSCMCAHALSNHMQERSSSYHLSLHSYIQLCMYKVSIGALVRCSCMLTVYITPKKHWEGGGKLHPLYRKLYSVILNMEMTVSLYSKTKTKQLTLEDSPR